MLPRGAADDIDQAIDGPRPIALSRISGDVGEQPQARWRGAEEAESFDQGLGLELA